MEFNFNTDAFIVRPTNEEDNEFIITIGDQIATPQKFKTRKEAEKAIEKRDWNLIVSLIITLGEKVFENLKNKEK